jgi:hypothetical protein
MGSYDQSLFVPLTDAPVGFSRAVDRKRKGRPLPRVEKGPAPDAVRARGKPARSGGRDTTRRLWYNDLKGRTVNYRLMSRGVAQANKRKGRPESRPIVCRPGCQPRLVGHLRGRKMPRTRTLYRRSVSLNESDGS